MHLRLLTVSAMIAYAIYLALSLIGGPTGLLEYAQLQEYQAALQRHGVELEYRQQLLLAEVRELQQSDQRLLSEARRAGYYQPHEYVIRINGLEEAPYLLTPGERFAPPPPTSGRRAIIRVIALCAGLIIYGVALFWGRAQPAATTSAVTM